VRIETLKMFCDLVDTESFSQAGRINGVSQPAASQQLANLEREFGTQLINRGGGQLAPTDPGKAMYHNAKKILGLYDRMCDEIRSAASTIGGVLRIGTIFSAGLYLLNACIRQFNQEHPEVDLRVEYTHWERIYAGVASGEMDIGVVANPHKQQHVDIIPITSEELVVVCAPSHRLAGHGKIDPAELYGEPFVAFKADIPTRRHIDRLLRNCKVKVSIAMEFDNIDTIKRAVEVGSGLSILPFGNVAREVADDRLRRVRFRNTRDWVRTLAVLRRRGRAPNASEQAFLRLLRARPSGVTE